MSGACELPRDGKPETDLEKTGDGEEKQS